LRDSIALKNVTEYVQAQNGTVVIEELPSWEAFFTKYVTTAQASVGVENTLVSRLIPTELFTNEAGKATLTNTMVQMIQGYNINPYIVVGTPFLFDGLNNATSVTPAWRHALWQVCVSFTEVLSPDEPMLFRRLAGTMAGSGTRVYLRSGTNFRLRTMLRSYYETWRLTREHTSCVVGYFFYLRMPLNFRQNEGDLYETDHEGVSTSSDC
jgi:hypothetical protein